MKSKILKKKKLFKIYLLCSSIYLTLVLVLLFGTSKRAYSGVILTLLGAPQGHFTGFRCNLDLTWM